MGKKLTLSIVLPVYNEEAELADSVGKLHVFLTKNLNDFSWNIIIADNASTDSTLSIGKKLSQTLPHVSIVHLSEKGRGRAVKYVWKKCGSDIVSYMDIDLSTDLKHFPTLVRTLLNGYDLAIGTRNRFKSNVIGRSFLRTLTSKGYIFLIKFFFWVKFTDAQCGFKAVTKKVVTNVIPYVKDNEWFFDSELLILAEKTGYKIADIPVTWVDNPGSTVRVIKTAQGDLLGLKRLYLTRPWKQLKKV